MNEFDDIDSSVESSVRNAAICCVCGEGTETVVSVAVDLEWLKRYARNVAWPHLKIVYANKSKAANVYHVYWPMCKVCAKDRGFRLSSLVINDLLSHNVLVIDKDF